MSSDAPQRRDLSAMVRDQMDELAMFSVIARNGLSWGQAAVRYEEVIGPVRENRLGQRRPTEEERAARQVHAQRIQRFSEEQAADDFPYLFNLLTIRVWTILENFVDEMVADQVSDEAVVTNLSGLENVQVPIVQYLAASEGERTEYIVDAIKQSSKARLKIGVSRFEALLSAVGLGGPVPESVKRTVVELCEVRNVLVHRDGVCDRRIPARAPWLGLGQGDTVAVTSGQFERYRRLPVWYTFELHRRAGLIEQGVEESLDQDLEEIEDWFNANQP